MLDMVKWWTVTDGTPLALFCVLAATAIGCGESTKSGDGDGGGGSTSTGGLGGSTTTGGSGGSTSTGGSSGSTTTGGSGGSTSSGGSSGAGGSAGSDPCGGCALQELCIYQAGGPGPGRLLCAENPTCRAIPCGCIRNQGTCTSVPPETNMGVSCQCDNGLE